MSVRIAAAIAVLITVSFGIAARSSQGDDEESTDLEALVGLLEIVIEADAETARQCLQTLGSKIRSGEANPKTVAELKQRLSEPLAKIVAGKANDPLSVDAALVAALWHEPQAVARIRAIAVQADAPLEQRRAALETLVFAGDPSALKAAASILTAKEADPPLLGAVLTALSRSESADVAPIVLQAYARLPAAVQPQAVELLTQRVMWGKALLAEVAAKRIPPSALNVNQVQKLASLGDQELTAAVKKLWGVVRTTRDPQRDALVGEMRKLLRSTAGDPHRGIAVFNKLCGQCHKIHGEGQEVGPDITSNGRASFDQLLSNVFDPSLVIGASYQARTIRTVDGRVISGLLAEDSPQRVVLKVQGGKLETIARDDVEAMKVSELSLMPEGIEKQLSPQEVADLFAFITLEKHPDHPSGGRIPGTPSPR